MRLNLLLDPAAGRPGYINLLLDQPGWRTQPVSLPTVSRTDYSQHCLPGQAEEILALNLLDYLSPDEVDETVDAWVDLLAYGGRLVLQTLDLGEICYHVSTGYLGEREAALELHGAQREPWEVRRATYSVAMLQSSLECRGLRVESIHLSDRRILLTAIRPHPED